MEKVNAVRVTVKKKMALRAAETISDINSMSKISIGEYRHLKKSYKGVKNVEVHHIIEKRLLRTMKTTCKKRGNAFNTFVKKST